MKLLERYRKWRHDRFLRKHGCSTQEQYDRIYDPDYNIRATVVDQYYHGYPYWHIFEHRDHYCYLFLADFGPGGLRYGYFDVQDWCCENLVGKFRMDFLRVINYPAKSDRWEINEIGGEDHIFMAFKDQQDYVRFLLRWT